MNNTFIFAGTFDPFTNGHFELVNKVLNIFPNDKIIIAFGNNEEKHRMFNQNKMVECVKSIFKDNDNVEVIKYDGLTYELAQKYNAILVRGLRNNKDLEYEKKVENFNLSHSKDNDGKLVETIYLTTNNTISSTDVRRYIEMFKLINDEKFFYSFEKKIDKYVPKEVENLILNELKNITNNSDENDIDNYQEEEIYEASKEDIELDNLIKFDMGNIWNEVGGQDGMYENFPIVRFYRSKNKEPYRAYALDANGGIGIIVYDKNINKDDYTRWKIVTLGEDDGYHFLNSANLYESYFGNKPQFLSLLTSAISIMNNNI